ncbi:hypothetical protein HYH03_013001 [Edaphochlamys debaryana]|uniref:RING-CH-type domain-containing protein n=1 Tax=Edaphochlamys debaryana TaxID=47281 RepID=A0A835XT35_9CHLO|nr:hypothetical protein HYH03_013001 [Edaphochlamys debaryana]|eukprot:KAG2488498.1 hypothetical protein HYH03_013001 [Edaphochlamys debaryana]
MLGRRPPSDVGADEESERLLAPQSNAEPDQQPQAPLEAQSSEDKRHSGQEQSAQPASTSREDAPAGPAPAEPTLASPGSTSSGSTTGTQKAKDAEVGLCRICLEEDELGNLEQPCQCTGTQKYAHHECIQRWVNEKGNLRCEICDSEYRGAFTVPAHPAGADEGLHGGPGGFPPLWAIRVDAHGDPLGGHERSARDFLDESDHYYQRNPLASWCFTFVIFIMFLIVLHHTMIVTDGYDTSTSTSPGSSPATGPGSGPGGSSMGGSGDDVDDYATSLTLFLFWIGTKAFLIGIPLYTVMRIAARQARREQYEAMLRSGAFEMPTRRVVWRMRMADADHAPERLGAGHNAV